MALTTRNARASVLLLALPFGRVFPNPDGLVGQADRQQAALSYAGLLAGEPIPLLPIGRRFDLQRQNARIDLRRRA